MHETARLWRPAFLRSATALAAVALLVAWLAWTPASAQTTTTFTVTLTNMATPGMSISPGAHVLSTAAGVLWMDGGTASLALERIAEIGDPSEAVGALGATMIDAAGAAGDTTTFEITAAPGDLLSFASMLVGSNDGFVGVNGLALFNGTTARTISMDLMAWDAGTEDNNDLNSGFAGGQPDPSQGAANVEHGTATSEPIAVHGQFSGAQATLMIAPMVAPPAVPAPAASGNAGLVSTGSGTLALVLIALGALTLVTVARRATAARSRR